ncbi:hypothetical protein L218DRAFT_358130 [Marasmius fiardii PR-910]|nr:hypothetical protein L218DRAFT_358130 [Marasmius fiardii PR-910]
MVKFTRPTIKKMQTCSFFASLNLSPNVTAAATIDSSVSRLFSLLIPQTAKTTVQTFKYRRRLFQGCSSLAPGVIRARSCLHKCFNLKLARCARLNEKAPSPEYVKVQV